MAARMPSPRSASTPKPSKSKASTPKPSKSKASKSKPSKSKPSKSKPSKSKASKPSKPTPGARVVAPVPTGRAPGEVRYWLLKSEPDVFSFDDLLAAPGRTTGWDSVRNYQARLYLRDGMRVGDLALFYHSNAEPSGVAGVCEIVREAYPDATQFDPASEYHEPRATPDAPVWMQVDVRAVERFPRVVALDTLKADPALAGMEVVRPGSRLSVQVVDAPHFHHVVALGRR